MTATSPAWRASDASLATDLRIAPSRVDETQRAASTLYQQARGALPGIAETVDAMMAAARQATLAAQPTRRIGSHILPADQSRADIMQYRIALRTAGMFTELLALTPDDSNRLRTTFGLVISGTGEARAILAKTPALAEWLAARDARNEAVEASQRTCALSAQTNVPRTLLEALRVRGLDLSVQRGMIVIEPSDVAKLLPGEADALRTHKAAIVTILADEDAGRPKPMRI